MFKIGDVVKRSGDGFNSRWLRCGGTMDKNYRITAIDRNNHLNLMPFKHSNRLIEPTGWWPKRFKLANKTIGNPDKVVVL